MGKWTESDLEALYLRLEKPVYNVVYRRLWDREEAQDVVQEAFVRLWGMRRRIIPQRVEPLVYRIALNLARSRLRRRRLWRFLSIDTVSPAVLRGPEATEPGLGTQEDRTRLRAAINELPADVRDVLLLTAFGGLGYAQVASALGIPEGTVGSRRNRALRLLRDRLTDAEPRRPSPKGVVHDRRS